jgi:hypothetical protein
MSKKNGKALKPQTTDIQEIYTDNFSDREPTSTLETIALSPEVEIQPKEVSSDSAVEVGASLQPIESSKDTADLPSVKVRRSSLQILIERRDKLDRSLKQLLTKERAISRKLEAQRKMVYGTILDRLIANGAVDLDAIEQNISQYLISPKERQVFKDSLVRTKKD